MADSVEQQLGNYRLGRLLGQGGFADVYLGEHIYLKTPAAIKVLRVRLTRDALDKFLLEARTIARLAHPNIIRVLEFGIEGSTPYLVMNYAPYGSLRQRHPMGSKLAATTVTSYVKQVTTALQYAHDCKIVHRDIKPENMLLDDTQTLMLSDFGLAISVHTMNSVSAHFSQHGEGTAGTTTYMAPEQFTGEPWQASDQYALGIVVYEWFCGVPPFRGTDMGVAIQHIQMPPPPMCEKVPNLPLAIEQVVLKALAKDPQARYPRIQDFADALEQASAGTKYVPLASTDTTQPSPSNPFPSPNAPLYVGSPEPSPRGYAAATVANHAISDAFAPRAHVSRSPASTPQFRGAPFSTQPTPTTTPFQLPRTISRRTVVAGLAGIAVVGLAGLGVKGLLQAHSPTPSHHPALAEAHNKAHPTPTSNAAATALASINTVDTRPAITSWGLNRLDLFARGIDNALWHRRYDGVWHPWESLGGTLVSDPVASSWISGRLDVFARGADQSLQHTFYDGVWHPWESLGGVLASDPTVTSWGTGRLDVFIRGVDSALWHIAYDGVWHPWDTQGGSIVSSPSAVAWTAGRLDIFARGASNELLHIAYQGAWTAWESLGGNFAADPSASSWGPGRLDIFARGTDDTLQHTWYDQGGWHPQESLGGLLTSSPSAVSWGVNRIDVFARGANNALQRVWFDGAWHPWTLFVNA